ncbi:hypothetical protein SO802_017099 [Lithocarpus litseifolius]|uniref:Uncharacterized protein n=1 Tax=Lithocarpus litseifolius TaxID=425828 RepID=A0AAW2CYC0_9ROSI
MAQKCMQKLLGKEFVKGTDNGSRHSYGSVNAKSPLIPIARKCGRCGSTTCQCSILYLSIQRSLDRDHHLCGADALRQLCLSCVCSVCKHSLPRQPRSAHRSFQEKKFTKALTMVADILVVLLMPNLHRAQSLANVVDVAALHANAILVIQPTHTQMLFYFGSNLSIQRSLDRDHRLCGVDTSRQAKSMSVSQMSKSDPDFDGAVSALDDENTCLSSQLTAPAIDAASQAGWSAPDFAVQLSPKKALCAALLKSPGDKADPLKMQQEKQRLERRQREGEFCKLILALCIKIQMHYSFVRVTRSFDLSSEGITLTA